MKIKESLLKEFLIFNENSLRDTLEETRQTIQDNSLYRYGSNKDKLFVLDSLKEDYAGNGWFNYLTVKGVIYNNNEFEINRTEFLELIKTCGVNLENTKHGLFANENDKEKPLAFKSYVQVNAILTYCLRLQIIKEFEEQIGIELTPNENSKPLQTEIKKINYSHPHFKKLVSETFFNFCLENTTEKVNRRFVSSLYGYLRGELKGTQYNFAIYWNNNYDYFSFRLYPLKKAGMDTYKGEKDDRFTTEFDQLREDFENIKEI